MITDVSETAIETTPGAFHITFDNALAFPGLINSHDHLDFNLFAPLGSRIYNNYTEWGKDIHKSFRNEIAAVLKVPVLFREQWGIFKNLLCGVTTVVNHGEKVIVKDALINVFERYYCLHSVQFEEKWKIKLNNPLKTGLPVVVHVGEGNDQLSHEEIDRLINWNLLQKKLIGVHGVAMSARQAKSFRALVWCPQSNYLLLDKTAPVNKLKKHTGILFGTDSTLTGNWNIWEHIRTARKTGMLTDTELYHTLNVSAANIWKTKNGHISPGYEADIVITTIKNNKSGMDAFFSTGPQDILMVLHKGNIRVFDESLCNQLPQLDLDCFSKVSINGFSKYVYGDMQRLLNNIQMYYPEFIFPVTIN